MEDSSSVEGEGTAEPGPGVNVQRSMQELLRSLDKSHGAQDDNSSADSNFEWPNPILSMDEILANRDEYYRSTMLRLENKIISILNPYGHRDHPDETPPLNGSMLFEATRFNLTGVNRLVCAACLCSRAGLSSKHD